MITPHWIKSVAVFLTVVIAQDQHPRLNVAAQFQKSEAVLSGTAASPIALWVVDKHSYKVEMANPAGADRRKFLVGRVYLLTVNRVLKTNGRTPKVGEQIKVFVPGQGDSHSVGLTEGTSYFVFLSRTHSKRDSSKLGLLDLRTGSPKMSPFVSEDTFTVVGDDQVGVIAVRKADRAVITEIEDFARRGQQTKN